MNFAVINISNGLSVNHLASVVEKLLQSQQGTHLVIKLVSPSYDVDEIKVLTESGGA